MNASVRDNISFGATGGDGSIDQTQIHAAALSLELDVFPAGDETVSEAIPAGQKARVALARALYASDEGGLALLDDPLAAVDTHVGAHLLVECICGVLSSTTRLLVTNQLQSNMDPANDADIQHVIRMELAEFMGLTIAHKLRTVMAADRVMVLDKGQLVQFDAQKKFQQEPSLLKDLAANAGIF